MRSALVLGPTGLVGHQLVEQLASDSEYERVTAFVRRPVSSESAKVSHVVIDYEKPETYEADLAVDDVFCCLGTTIKKAGSPEAFTHVDRDLPLAMAKASLAAGAKRFIIVTAVSSDSKSGRLYSRVKGELEDALRELAFPDGIVVIRPSLLLGDREEKRFGEEVATVIMGVIEPIFSGGWAKYRAIRGADVASALIAAAKSSKPGFRVVEGDDLFALVHSPG